MAEEKVIRVHVTHELSPQSEQVMREVVADLIDGFKDIAETFGRVFGSQF